MSRQCFPIVPPIGSFSHGGMGNGGMGYGEAKELLYNHTLSRFSKNRELFFELHSNRDKVEQLLLEGALKARKQAQNVLKRVRARVGF